MPKLQVVRQQDGSAAALMPDGSLQPIPDNMLREVELPLSQIRNEQGIETGERMSFMNLANSPELARGYLESRGYETRRLPADAGAWNFAVRKSPKDPWRIVDPVGGLDANDILDLLGDLGVGAVSGIGAAVGSALGPVGTALGAGAGGALGEGARQMLGAGVIPGQGMDATQIGVSGALSAASVPAAAGAGIALRAAGRAGLRTARAAGRVGNEFAARMASVGEAGALSAGDVNLARMLEPESPLKKLPSVDANAREFIRIIGRLNAGQSTRGPREAMFPEKAAEMAMLSKAAKPTEEGFLRSTGTVNLTSAAQRLMSLIRAEGEEPFTKTTSGTVRTIGVRSGKRMRTAGRTQPKEAAFTDLQETTVQGSRARGPKKGERTTAREAQYSDVTQSTTRTVSGTRKVELPLTREGELEALKWPAGSKEAKKFIDYLQSRVLGEHPMTTVPVDIADAVAEEAMDIAAARGGRFGEVLEQFATGVRAEILDVMGGPRSAYGLNRAVLEARNKSLTAIKRAMGWGKPKADVEKQTVQLLKALDADSHAGFLGYVSDIEKQFGLESDTLLSLVRRSALAQSFGKQGRAEILGPITAMGGFRGAGLIGGGAGLLLGGVPGAIAGTAAGMALGSPRTLALATKAGLRVGQALTSTEAQMSGLRLSPAMRGAVVGGLRVGAAPFADSGVAREKPRRKQVYIGQF